MAHVRERLAEVEVIYLSQCIPFPFFRLLLSSSSRCIAAKQADHDLVLRPAVNVPFANMGDAVRRLLAYHVWHKPPACEENSADPGIDMDLAMRDGWNCV